MLDLRLKQLGDTLLHYSCDIKEGDKVLIDATKNCGDLVKYLIKECYASNAIPFVILKESDIRRELIIGGNKEQFKLMAKEIAVLMEQMDAYIEITEYDNFCELHDIPIEKRQLFQKYFFQSAYKDKHSKKWVTVGYPNTSMAQRFGMSTENFEDYYFSVVNQNYKELSEKMFRLKEYMDKAKVVQIKAPNTDLVFNIGGMKSFVCDGKINLPDGEVFVAPNKYSANGIVTFNSDSLYQGYNFSNISLTFKNGKVVKAETSQHQKELSRILNTDEEASYIGEFALGTNPKIDRIVKNILYDEKILGSYHIAMGQAHTESDNGNRSAIHWDMVSRLDSEYGGGQILFDDLLIMQDGEFIPKDLKPLNRERKLTLKK